jgi:hypothetical protein
LPAIVVEIHGDVLQLGLPTLADEIPGDFLTL